MMNLSKRGFAALIGVILLTAPMGAVAASAAEPSLHIMSPKADEVIKGDAVTIEWMVEMGGTPGHVHVKIDDGRPMVAHANSKKLTGLKPGKHTVTVWVVDADHQPIGLEESVTFTIE
ncbi:MAG: DUF6130 family protein [Nitrospirota bacterium]